MTQRKRSQSETPEDFVFRFLKVSQSPPAMWLYIFKYGSAPSNTYPVLDDFPAGETGLLVAKIGERNPFSGYAKNKQQTEKKKLRDVFVKGDLYFNSGDLLKIDSEGFVFFQDRIGDTFRCVDETFIKVKMIIKTKAHMA